MLFVANTKHLKCISNYYIFTTYYTLTKHITYFNVNMPKIV